MQVELIEATPNPEELVAKAARNDYRSDGVIDYSFEEVMEAVEADEEHIETILRDKDTFSEEAFRRRGDVAGDDPLGERWLGLFGGEGRDVEIEAKKRTLIDKLISDGHWGPAEHPQATIALEGVTRVSMAQITRHRHFTFDVMSLRYVQPEAKTIQDRFSIPPEVMSEEAVSREGVNELEQGVPAAFDTAYYEAMNYYEKLLDKGTPQEEARKVLPMGTKVNIVMSGNARAWMHLLNIRGKANVQGEARRIADGIMDELQEWMEYTFTKFDEDVLPLKLNP